MIRIVSFDPVFIEQLPAAHQLLLDAGLDVHDAIDRVILHGSRGLQGGPGPDSDIDLSLVVNDSQLNQAPDRAAFLERIINTTLAGWRSQIECDLAAVFDKNQCGLRCLNVTEFDPELCPVTVDCLGIYKIQKGFSGFVSGPEVDCSRIYPLITVWTRTANAA